MLRVKAKDGTEHVLRELDTFPSEYLDELGASELGGEEFTGYRRLGDVVFEPIGNGRYAIRHHLSGRKDSDYFRPSPDLCI